jgi:phosphate starvation-inducible protein PhoH|nr:MAG TPA: PhoH-like protein [Caudoviricetes sp.]
MKFYDTSALLDIPPDTLLAQQFLIADITLYELEDIKTSGKKDEATKAKAHTVTRLLAEHPAAYTVVSIDYPQLLSILNDVPVKDNNDGTIMAAARWYLNELQNKLDNLPKELDADSANEAAELTTLIDSFRFVTSDLSCFNLAQRVMKLPCELSLDHGGAHNDYAGWTEVALEDGGEEALAMAYSKDIEQKNLFDTPTNGYVLIPNADADGNTAGLRWDGSRYVPIKYKNLNTAYSGKIKPLNNQQKLAFDLLQNDDITIKLLLGVYGSGKDFLMVNHAVDLIEKGKYDKIVWVRNNIEVKDTKEIGFLPGSMLEKVYPFAAILADCLGGEVALERAITDGWVEIQPLGFIRGRSFNRSIIYCSEAENLTKQHIQLLIGRVGEGSTLWINGDLRQIDDVAFERNNGIQKLIDKLTGNERFGTVYLPITERSETARLADLLD